MGPFQAHDRNFINPVTAHCSLPDETQNAFAYSNNKHSAETMVNKTLCSFRCWHQSTLLSSCFLLLLLLTILSFTTAQEIFSVGCDASSCEDCIGMGCGWVPILDNCLKDCSFIADIPCYSPSTTTNVCAQVAEDLENKARCSSAASSCEACTQTFLVDGITTCQWHSNPEFPNTPGYCGTGGCNLLGLCGSFTCPQPDTGTACDALNNDCAGCLSAGCGFAQGRLCLEDCSLLADASCFQNVASPDATCSGIEQDAVDRDLCALSTDCGSCTSTAISNGNTCKWFIGQEESRSYCGNSQGCDFLGICGVSECPMVDAQCNNASSCEECLIAGCGFAADNICIQECNMIADASCFQNVPSPVATCSAIAQNRLDRTTCATSTDCATCTTTTLSNGDSCKWFTGQDESGSYCSNDQGCDFLGICGSTECAAEQACARGTSCEDCLGSGCAWAVGECLESCDRIADAGCFQNVESPDATCAAIVQDDADRATCLENLNCASCTQTPISNGDACKWFSAPGGGGRSYCSNSRGCDFLGICGSSECAAEQVCADGTSCEDCLGSGCAWAVGGCLPSCDFIADAACFQDVASPAGTCTEIDTDEQDYAICSVNEDCGSCVQTQTSRNATCNWFAGEFAYCSNAGGGDLDGVIGSRTCGAVHLCTEKTSCVDCLGGGCGWAVGMCLESCSDIADVGCSQNVADAQATCDAIDRNNQVLALCSAQTNCSTCASTTISEGQTCKWFAESSYCSNIQGCDFFGDCGSTECIEGRVQDDTSNPPQAGTSTDVGASGNCPDLSCFDCLSSGCVWSADRCLNTCDEIQDAVVCFDPKATPMNTSTTCEMISKNRLDFTVCSALSDDCEECITTPIRNSTCRWFEGEGMSYCSNVQGCDMNGLCGTATTCPARSAARSYFIAYAILTVAGALLL